MYILLIIQISKEPESHLKAKCSSCARLDNPASCGKYAETKDLAFFIPD